MLVPVLAIALAASPSAKQAAALAASGSWDELYVAFGSTDPKMVPAADRKAIAAALSKGCQRLEASDAAMAFTLGERARVFEGDADALLCLFRTAGATGQGAAARDALEDGVARFPRDGRLAFYLARRLLELEPERAVALLGRVTKGAKEYAEAQQLLEAARRSIAVEAAIKGQTATASAAGGERASGLAFRKGEDFMGMETRENERFTVRYYKNRRDSSQLADYEDQIGRALDEAYEASRSALGVTCQKPLRVMMYSREEFTELYGSALAAQVAGQFTEGKLRINDAMMFDKGQYPVLVHEYAHAVVDELAGGRSDRIPHWLHEGIAEWVRWQYEREDSPPKQLAGALRQAQQAGRLPPLSAMIHMPPLYSGNARLAYATCGSAVGLLVEQSGVSTLLKAVEDLGRGKPLDMVMQDRFGRSLDKLEEELASDLSRR